MNKIISIIKLETNYLKAMTLEIQENKIYSKR